MKRIDARPKSSRTLACKTIVLWWLVNDKEPEGLRPRDKRISSLMPLVETMFPGINYFSITGFSQVMNNCVIPVLKKRYRKLLTAPAERIRPNAVTKVTTFLPSDGYEWQDSSEWKTQYRKLLRAA